MAQVKGTQVGGENGKSSSTRSSGFSTASARKEQIQYNKSTRTNTTKAYTSADSARAKAKAREAATGGSAYDAEAARQAELERQRKIKEYQELMRKIAETRAKLSRANNQLNEAKDILKTAYTGNKADEYLKAIKAVQDEISTTDKYFKGVNDAAAEKIKGLGGIPTNGTETNAAKTGENAQTTPKTFSCDTEALRDILPLLDSAYKDLEDAKTETEKLPALEGCTDARKTSTKVGEVMNEMTPLTKKLLKDIEAAERAERENRSFIDKMFGGIGDFFGNLFKPESKPNTNIDTNTNTYNSPFTSAPLLWQDDSLWKNFGTPKVPFGQTTDKDVLYMIANKNEIDTKGKTDKEVLEEASTKILADEYDIETKGKTQGEILKEIADKTGIDTKNKDSKTILNEIVAESEGTVGGELIIKLDDIVTNSTTFKKPTSSEQSSVNSDKGTDKPKETNTSPEVDANNGNDNSNTSDNKQETSNKTNYESNLRSGISYGPQAYETYYYDDQNPKSLSGVVRYLEDYEGFKDLVHYTREDGVFMLSGTKPNGEKFEDLVMVAADVKHLSNPDGTFERGQIVETSVGTGIIADSCDKAIIKRINNEGVQFDIGTAWHYKPNPPYDRNEYRGKKTSKKNDEENNSKDEKV